MALSTIRRRRDLALSAQGFNHSQVAQLTKGMPYTRPYLFLGQFTPRIKVELTLRQQASDLSSQLQMSRPVACSRDFPCPSPQPRLGRVAPAPQRGRRACSHSHRGKFSTSAVMARWPRAAVAFDCSRVLGPPLGRAATWRPYIRPPIMHDAFVLLVANGFTIHLVDMLPRGIIRLLSSYMPLHTAQIAILCRSGVVESSAYKKGSDCLLYVFLVPKLSGKVSDNSQPEENQCTHSPLQFTYGNSQNHTPPAQTRRLDCRDRPQGCLSSHPDRCGIQTPAGIHGKWSSLLLQGRTLWPMPMLRVFTRLVGCVAAFLWERGL